MSPAKKINAIGYKIVQISGTALKADIIRDILNKHDLKAVISRRNFNDFKNNLDEVIDYSKNHSTRVAPCGRK